MFKCSKCRIETAKQGYCSECQKAYNKAYRIKHGQPIEKKQTRVCNRCHVEKQLTEFRAKEVYFCIACTQKRGGKGGAKKKYTEEENRQRKNAAVARYKARNKVTLSQKRKLPENRIKNNERTRKYRQTDNGRAITIVQHIRRRSPGNTFTAKEWRELVDRYNHTCLCCGDNTCKLTPDHVIPLSKGGANTIDNIQPLCLPCNLSKGIKIVDYRS